jgi:hypothetical protein
LLICVTARNLCTFPATHFVKGEDYVFVADPKQEAAVDVSISGAPVLKRPCHEMNITYEGLNLLMKV